MADLPWRKTHIRFTSAPLCPPKSGTVAEERRLLSRVAKLTQLRSLHLDLSLDPSGCTLNAMRRHAPLPAHLSALTALTSLQLELPDCYEPAGDSWERQQQDGRRHAAWEEVREAHRTSLLSALRHMPHLQDLTCRKLWLQPSELACLTALTSLTLGGLLPPERQQPNGNSIAAAVCTLPPRLQTLILAGGASPSFLATFQPPPSLKEFNVSCVRFGMADVSPYFELLPQAARDVSSAAVLLAGFAARAVRIVAECCAGLLEPFEDAADSHEAWIRGLGPLSTSLKDLTIQGVQLLVGDLACLVSTLPELRVSDMHGVCRRKQK